MTEIESRVIDMRKGKIAFKLQKMQEIYHQSNGKADSPHRHDYYTILYIDDAKGLHHIDYERYAFGRSQVHFVAPGQVHQVALNAEPKGYVITFTKAFLASNNIQESFISNVNLFKPFGITPPLSLDKATKARLERTFDEMQECYPLNLKYSMRAMGALLQLFLIYCNNSLKFDTKQNDEQDKAICLLRDFKRLVDKNYKQWHKIGPYAEKVHITGKHLSATVKQNTGKTAKEFIQDRILLEAKRLLLFSELNIKEVAYELGFQEPMHFSAFFKKRHGAPPSEYRNKKG